MDGDEDAVDAGFVAAEDASPTAPTSRRARPRFPSLPPPARMCSRARTTPSRRTARVRLSPASRATESFARGGGGGGGGDAPSPPVGITPAPAAVPELSAARSRRGRVRHERRRRRAETLESPRRRRRRRRFEADPGFGGGGVGPPRFPACPAKRPPLEDPWVTCRPVVPAPDAPPATDAGETRRNRDDPDSIGLARLARLASPREFVSRSARSALDDREKELAKALRLCEKPWMELTVAETGLILAQIKYLITRRRRKHAGGSHARVRRAGDQEDENERVDGEEDEDHDEADERRRAEIVCVRGVRRAFSQRHRRGRQRTHGRQAVRVRRVGAARRSRRARRFRGTWRSTTRRARATIPGCLRAARDAKRTRRAPGRTRNAAVRVRVPGCTKRFKNEDC